jgi:hypothetical protein
MVYRLTLPRVARHNKALVNVQASSRNNLAFLRDEFAVLYPRHSVQLVVPEFLSLALEVLRYPDLIANRQGNGFCLEHVELAGMR